MTDVLKNVFPLGKIAFYRYRRSIPNGGDTINDLMRPKLPRSAYPKILHMKCPDISLYCDYAKKATRLSYVANKKKIEFPLKTVFLTNDLTHFVQINGRIG